MKSYYNRKQKMDYIKDLRVSIHNTYSYTELIQNCVAVPIRLMPELLTTTREILVVIRSSSEDFGYVVDLSALKIVDSNNKYYPDRAYLTPLTTDLLDLYGVSPEQFVNDFFDNVTSFI